MNDAVLHERERWNTTFLNEVWRSTRFNEEPNKLLSETVRSLPRPGTALDVNMGEGRNAIFLAQNGWNVTGIDIADKAMEFAQRRAQELGLHITTLEHDVETYEWGTDLYDLIVLSYSDESTHVHKTHRALKSGGVVVFENFHIDINEKLAGKLEKPIGFSEDLKHAYIEAGFQVLRYEEPIGIADFSKESHRLVKLVACKL